MKTTLFRRGLLIVAVLFLSTRVFAQQAVLQSGDMVAIIGDSITEQKQYSVFMEDYLLMCQPAEKLATTQFGWGGETSWGFFGRLQQDLLPFKPTVATTFYGMNDGGYGPINDGIAAHYRDNQTKIVQAFKANGVRLIVLGTPGCVDSTTFRNHNAEMAAIYNKTLGQLGDIDREIATQEGVVFANVHQTMMDAMAKAKAKYGDQYVFAGNDGVHPGPNGHIVTAYAFLKAMGCKGDIGTITADLAAKTATATDGHTVQAFDGTAIDMQSTRYPFCFSGDPKDSNATSGIIEFIPFNQDINRFMLVVKNAKPGQYKVTFGKASQTYSAEQLTQGINLAADFLDNPFGDQFRQVENTIRDQQNYETQLIKNYFHMFPDLKKAAPDEAASLDRVMASLMNKEVQLRQASAAAVQPVKYSIKIEAVEAK